MGEWGSTRSPDTVIVWHPANPSDKVVRVLFPGNATQDHIFEGLEKLKHLEFLKQPVVTQKTMPSSTPSTPTLKQAKMKQRTDSKESLKSTPKPSPSKVMRKISKEERPQEKEQKANADQTGQNETPEKKSEAKTKIEKIKKEAKASAEKKKEVKKEIVRKDETKKEEKVKKDETKKVLKKDIRRDSPMKEKREEKKEQKKDVKKLSKDVKKTSTAGEEKSLKPKPLKKDDSLKKDLGAPSKVKDKGKSKVTKKDTKVENKPVASTGTVAEDPEAERSLMSSPEDLTKDFEELRAEELVEDDAIVQQDEEKEALLAEHEQMIQTKESPEGLESVDEGITTTEAEGESGGTPEEQVLKGKLNVSACEKFEDEGTVMEETSEGGDYEEKGETEEVYEPQEAESNKNSHSVFADEHHSKHDKLEQRDEANHNDDIANKNVLEEHLSPDTTEKQKLCGSASPKVSSPVSPAASIHDEIPPVGFESFTASDEENRDEPLDEYTVTSGYTQSTMEISSLPTPMDEMLTPRDILSDKTTNDEIKPLSQDAEKFGKSGSGEFVKKDLSPLEDLPGTGLSQSDVTEGQYYHHSASTVSPPSPLKEDQLCEKFESVVKQDEFPTAQESNIRHDSVKPNSVSTTSPLVSSPSVEFKNIVDSPALKAAPIELSSTLASGTQATANSYKSLDDKPLEEASSPQSSGHTPYYQSPVDEKVEALPPLSEEISQGPVIVEVTGDKEDPCSIITTVPNDPVVEQSSPVERADSPLKSPSILEPESPHKSSLMNADTKKSEENSHPEVSSTLLNKHEPEVSSFSTFKEESKMSISEGTTSDKSETPLEEVVAEDTFSHLASASTASLATSSFPEPTTGSPSLHAEVGSPHSTEVDDSLSVSVVQTPTTFHEAEGSPTKEDSPRAMSISPEISPKTKSKGQTQDTKSPEHSTMSLELGQESPDHSLALDFSKQSPEHQSLGSSSHATENGPTEVDYSPSHVTDVKTSRDPKCAENTLLFEEGDSARATSATPSDASQSSVITPCQMTENPNAAVEQTDRSPASPRASSLTLSPHSNEPSPVLGGPPANSSTSPISKITSKSDSEQKLDGSPSPPNDSSPSASFNISKGDTFFQKSENNPFKCDDSKLEKNATSPKVPSLSEVPLSFDPYNLNSPCGSREPDSLKKSPCATSKTDVDLCLVKSCEYRHPKTELSPSFINPNPLEYFINEENALDEEKPLAKSGDGPPPPGGKLSAKQCEDTPPTSISESAPSQTDSDVPPGTEECPSITADANIDSEDDSETLPSDRTLMYRHADPPPMALRDSAPTSGNHDVCMVDPEALKAEENLHDANKDAGDKLKKKKLSKKSSSPARKSGLSKVKDAKTASPKKGVGEGKDVKNATNTSASKGVKSSTLGTGSGKVPPLPSCPPMYMDLVYIPNHCSAKNVDAEFFKRVRSAYYVVSGNNQTAQEPSRAVLDALLEGKAQWGNNMQVTLIPTHDTDVMREWYQETHDKQQELNIMVLASSSTVVMQDESFPACKIEL